jgi:high affinity sulfate transporter 1
VTPPRRGGVRLFDGILPIAAGGVRRDVLAGLTLAAMNVPQALGYTRIAGMPVITGLYTLLLPLLAFATFGSSRYLVVAADSATAAILTNELVHMAPLASEHYVALAGLVALLTGACLLLARVFRLGFLADFLSQTVLVGFLTGVGVQVGIAVLGEMLGLTVSAHRTLEQLADVVRQLPQVHLPTLAVSGAVVAIVLLGRSFAPRLPVALVAVAGSIAASATFDFAGRGISVLGPIEGGLPRFSVPSLRPHEVWELLPVAASCFLMIVAQSAATARAWAARHGDALDENDDLVGLGAANVAAALSGTFVVNGSPTQTAMVESSGGRSQMAQVATAAAVALVLLFLAGPLQYLPHGVLGAIVFAIAIGLIDLRGLRDIRRESPSEFHLAVATAVVVVAVGVEQGILLAMGLALVRHVRHAYQAHAAVLVQDPDGSWRPTPAVAGAVTAPGLIVYKFGAELFYANVGRFAEDLRGLVASAPSPVRWLVLDAGAVTNVDYSAARTLRAVLDDLGRRGVRLLVVHAPESLRISLVHHRLLDTIGRENLLETLRDALARVRACQGR